MEDKELLFKYLASEFDENEILKLEEELKSNEELALELGKVKKVWDFTSLDGGEVEVDLDRNWSSIQNKLGWDAEKEANPTQIREIRSRSSIWLKIAAMVILASGVAFTFFDNIKGLSFGDKAELISVTGNAHESGFRSVLLPDGSSVVLNNDAEISYSADFKNEKTRKVELKGEAFFDVARNESKPFIITTKEGTGVTVLGTSFNVKSGAKYTIVSVVTGKVQVANKHVNGEIVVTKGQRAIYDQNAIAKSEIYDVNDLAWKTGVLEFKSNDLPYVIDKLEAHYKVSIEIKNEKINNCSITTRLENQPLSSAIEILSAILSADIKLEGDKLIIDSEGC